MNEEVEKILVLATAENQKGLESSTVEQFKSFINFLNEKIDDFSKRIEENVLVFSANFIQNKYYFNPFSIELANLFQQLEVHTVAEFENAVKKLKTDPETAEVIVEYEKVVARWDALISSVDERIDAIIGKNPFKPTDSSTEHLPFVAHSPYDLYMATIVTSCSSAAVNEHILSLYNMIETFHRLKCDVILLAKTNMSSVNGGGYLKLVGVPFRKMYDTKQAENELKTRRIPTETLASFKSILSIIEISIGGCDLSGKHPTEHNSGHETQNFTGANETDTFMQHNTGCIIFDKTGAIHYKHDEKELNGWPTTETLVEVVRKIRGVDESALEKSDVKLSNAKVLASNSKVDSEISAEKKEKKCCTIL